MLAFSFLRYFNDKHQLNSDLYSTFWNFFFLRHWRWVKTSWSVYPGKSYWSERFSTV